MGASTGGCATRTSCRCTGPSTSPADGSPTLLIYAFVNWDLLAVALATVGTLLYLRGRDRWSGVAIGLGAAAKLYPALLLVPFALGRLREGRRRDAARLLVSSAAAFAVVNLPFVAAAFRPWSTFFRFNTHRPLDWDSLWFVACQRLEGGVACSRAPHLTHRL